MPVASREPAPDEQRHIRDARKGDKEAYRHLVAAYQDRLFRLVLSMVRQSETAEDLTQEIFVKAFFALPSFQGDSAFYTWLFRIGSNHCLDHLRRKVPPTVSMDAVSGPDEDLSMRDTFEAPASERPEGRLEARDEVSAVLATLDHDQRLVLTLREVEGFSYEELAGIMKCNVNTIKSRLNRAREALKVAYRKKFGNISDANAVQKEGETV